MKGRAIACASTAGGNCAGRLLAKRAFDFSLRSARNEDVLLIALAAREGPAARMAGQCFRKGEQPRLIRKREGL